MKVALVTGSAGFVGRHMVQELMARDYAVTECDLASWTPSDALELFRLEKKRFHLVVHCAAQAPHRAAIDQQPATHAHNQLLDAAMFDWAIRTKQRRILYFSSSAAYPLKLQGADAKGGMGEDAIDLEDVSQPDTSYGWTKLTGERMAADARASWVPVTVVRPFSGYGEDQGTDWPFGAFMDRAQRHADPFTVWGDGTQVRDWIHIDDVVAGALAVADSGTEDPVNLCTGTGTSMADLIDKMTTAVGYKPKIDHQPGKPNGVQHRVGDASRLLKFYTPKVSIDEGVTRALGGGVSNDRLRHAG